MSGSWGVAAATGVSGWGVTGFGISEVAGNVGEGAE